LQVPSITAQPVSPPKKAQEFGLQEKLIPGGRPDTLTNLILSIVAGTGKPKTGTVVSKGTTFCTICS
jgi:hypothetical protein